ncbi:MAG: hemerythrin domain-containing protein [Candidatus Pacearchaeota archaeon]|jgi:hemerythrin
MEEISGIMKKEHARLYSLFFVIKEKIKQNSEDIKELIQEFIWELDKHFFLEEKLIFSIYSNLGNIDVLDLIKEHKDILWKVNRIYEIRDEIQDLDKLLLKHSDSEDKNFYPFIDKSIDNENKKIILSRLNEIIE